MAASRWPLVALLLGLLLASSPPASLAEEEAAWESCAAGCPDLSAHNLDLAPLRGMWEAVYLKETESSTTAHVPYFFNFTLCNPLPDTGSCKDSSHVCFTKYFDEFYSLGSHASCQYRYSERRVQFSFSYGDETKEKIGNGNVSITLICGRSLGVPEVIKGDPDDLEVEILWITSAACKTTSPLAARNESKCYFFQHSESSGTKAHFVDLSGLIRPVGFEGVHAARTEARFQISVCRPLETEDACNGAAVCLKTNDSHFELEKEATTPLALAYDEGAESRLLLQGSLLTVSYWGRDKLSICGGSRRQVDVHFLCPTEDEEYGPSVSYLDDSLCLVLVNWFTSYACGTTAVEARGCQLTTSTGVHFDLSGLGGDKVVTASGPGEHPYSYALEICSGRELTGDCAGGGPGDAPVRAAQFDGGTCRSLGTGDGKLRYADGVLSLTYTFGETCHSNYARTSVVNFVCSEDVSKNATGLSFLGEENCHYEFEWATPLACRGAESSGVASCHFELGGHEYNFSPLVGTADKNWVAVDDDRTTECFLINPCGEVATKSETKTAAELCQSRLAPESACSGTSVCQVLRNGTGVRIGRFNLQAVSNLTLVDTNVVTVIGEGDAHHKAVVHYVCKTGDMTSPPVFVGKTNGAFYEFHWATFAACPLGVQTGSDCLVTDATTGFAFNLTALKPFKYLFIGAGYDFDLAVCAELNGTDCPAHTALCQTGTDNGHAKSLGLVNSTLIYADGTLKLHYTGGDPCSKWPHRNSTIIFLCDSSAHFPVVNHIQEDYCQYVVEVRTKLACPPAFRATECALVQDNVTLDFSVLSRETGNWQAVGPDGAAYYINLCQPLNRVVGCSPLAAVCKVKMEGGKVTYTNLGLASSAEFVPLGDRPSFHEEHVVMSYSYSHPAASQGSECETTHVKIFLVCDHTAEEETSPEFTSGGDKADPCTYTFHWRTLAACRVRPVTSRTCFLTDPESGYTFDLNPVHSPEHAFYSVSDGHFAYNVTACAPLVGDCKSGQANATLCQGLVSAAAGDRTKNFKCGDFSTQRLRYLDGSLVLSYGGGEPCHHPKPGTPRSVVINFECDRSLYVGTPKYIHEQDCQYVFEWPTALACKPRELECVAGGGKYDLRPLLESREWQVNLQGVDMGPWEVVIGGCRSLDLSARPECPQIPGLAACSFVPGYKPGHATALGFVTGDLVEEERGVLRLSYHNGDRCHSDGGRGRNHVVNVFFRCDTGEGVGVPTAISNSNCSLDIDWVTRYACPRDTPGPASSSSSAAAWTLTDPVSSHTYNLTTITPLLSADTSLEVGSPSHQYTYTLGLGGKPVPCAGSHGDVKEKNFGACQTRTSGDPSPKLLGQVNSTLLLVGGKVKVIYTGGDICHHNGVHRKTVVTFECDRSREGDARLEVLPEEDCEYAMLVFTKLACHAQQDIGVECLVPGFSDIGSLANMHTPAITVETGLLGAAAVMYLSVCQPIGFGNQVEGTAVANCPGGSAACVHWKGNNTWMSLGRPDRLQPPRLLDAGNGVVLSYSGGDSCGGGGLKTKLVLLCNRNELEGAPTFVGREGCQFMFRWESRFACPIQIPSSNVSTTQCSISDPASGHNFSFTKLSSQVVRGKGSATPTYHIQLCGSAPASGSDCSGICRETSGGGRTSLLGAKHRFVITSHSPHVIEVVYPSGTECSRGRKWEGLVTLQCKPRNGTAAPVLVSDSDCRLEFLWQNESFCVGEEVCVAVDTKTGYTYDLDGLLSTRWSVSCDPRGLQARAVV